MIALIGIKKEVPIQVREKLTMSSEEKSKAIKSLSDHFKEVVIVNTCNRTEIYFNHSSSGKEILKKIFDLLTWDFKLMDYVFYKERQKVTKHLFEVSCGYHSRIIGEEQILGQIRICYRESLEMGVAKGEIGRLFETAIACGKKFIARCKLYEIPVSSASIVSNHLAESSAKKVMIVGYGKVSKLVIQYVLNYEFEEIIIILRDIKKAGNIENKNIKFQTFDKIKEKINEVDAIISCTSSKEIVISKDYIKSEGKDLIIYDLAVPRDIDPEISNIPRVKVYNIDYISKVNDKNKSLRIERMDKYRWIIDEFIENYQNYKKIIKITPIIKEMKEHGEGVYKKRLKSFNNKSRGNLEKELAQILLKSTSDAYVNRAIEVLKEETLKGGEEECLRILKKIFL